MAVENAAPTVTALFAPLPIGQFALTVIPDGGGRINLSPQTNLYSSGQKVALTAQPDAEQTFLGWTGDATGTENPLTVTMNQSLTITATFTKRPRLAIINCAGERRDDVFQFSLIGEMGTVYQIETTSNLKQWMPWITVTNTFGTLQFTDPLGTNGSQRFYRAELLP